MTKSAAVTSGARKLGPEYENYDEPYRHWIVRLSARVAEVSEPIFTTDAPGLYGTYIAELPLELQGEHLCRTCQHFIERFGGLVTVDPATGEQQPLLWSREDTDSEIYAPVVNQLARVVRRANITGVFKTSEHDKGVPKIGVAVAGGFDHLHARLHRDHYHNSRTLTAEQRMAELKEEYGMLQRSLADYKSREVHKAVELLQTDQLYRSEKVLGVAEWLKGLHDRLDGAPKGLRSNLVWYAVATAPAGFCHVRSSMIGTLLDDLSSGMRFELVAKRFADKMHPLAYQRPQAAPGEGNVKRAEELVAKLGIERSLPRRYARLDELELLWHPRRAANVEHPGVFGGVATKQGAQEKVSSITSSQPLTLTWDKFARTVLPVTAELEVYLDGGYNSFCGLLTAVHDDAPPILQWDSESRRNSVSWYLWHGGSKPSQWGLRGGQFHRVTGVTLRPNMWDGSGRFDHHGKGAVLVIEGAKETSNPGACLFPEMLRSELREVRATIEAYSRDTPASGAADGSANGLMLQDGVAMSVLVRVTTETGSKMQYKIDRWD